MVNSDKLGHPLKQFIIYACPVGELNQQIEQYLQQSLELCGANSAHKYMPHCTLTGFFETEIDSIPVYLQALNSAYKEAQNYSLNIKIKRLIISQKWHGLELQSDRLKQLIANFAQAKTLEQCSGQLRLKDWLHLSLAYGFDAQEEHLKQLAVNLIDIKANVNWELRFYQKNPDWSWQCLQSWTLK